MLLDISLPEMTGFALLEELRKSNLMLPTIMLSSSDSEVHKVKALDMGADDYVSKPFSFPELVARINAVLRRAETARDYHITQNARLTADTFEFCRARVNPTRLEIAFPSGACEKIGRKELGIIVYLVSNPNTVLTRRSLIHAVWGIHADVRSRSLDQYIVKIRDLYNRNSCALDAFRTIHGVGYIYDTSSAEAPAEEQAAAKG